jgi:hypothetical protein
MGCPQQVCFSGQQMFNPNFVSGGFGIESVSQARYKYVYPGFGLQPWFRHSPRFFNLPDFYDTRSVRKNKLLSISPRNYGRIPGIHTPQYAWPLPFVQLSMVVSAR